MYQKEVWNLFQPKRKLKSEESPQQPTFHSTNVNNQATISSENNEPKIVEEDVVVLTTTDQSREKKNQSVQPTTT